MVVAEKTKIPVGVGLIMTFLSLEVDLSERVKKLYSLPKIQKININTRKQSVFLMMGTQRIL